MQNRSELLVSAISCALAAGSTILEIYASSSLDVQKKSDDSPLTLADRRAHEIIMAGIGVFGIPVLSEEGRHIPFDERKGWSRLWIVDPLDGTKEFIKRNGEFTVNIALAEGQRPTLGVIFVPVTDTLYFADLNRGAYRIDACRRSGIGAGWPGEGDSLAALLKVALRLPLKRDPGRPFTIMGSRSHATSELDAYVADMRNRYGRVDFIAAGSSLKICRVAEGGADLYPRLGPTMEWDTAAGQAIAEASDAQVVRHDDGRVLTYNKSDLCNPWFIVQRASTHPRPGI